MLESFRIIKIGNVPVVVFFVVLVVPIRPVPLQVNMLQHDNIYMGVLLASCFPHFFRFSATLPACPLSACTRTVLTKESKRFCWCFGVIVKKSAFQYFPIEEPCSFQCVDGIFDSTTFAVAANMVVWDDSLNRFKLQFIMCWGKHILYPRTYSWTLWSVLEVKWLGKVSWKDNSKLMSNMILPATATT